MGLLTDTRAQALLSQIILAVYRPVGIILYVAGVASFVALAFMPLNANTYFSENALLPGLVERKYQSDQDVKEFVKELTRFSIADGGRAEIPVEWLQTQFVELGLDVYTQNFTVSHPFMGKSNNNQEAEAPVTGTNVYAILRAPRIASTEAMVVTVPYRNKQTAKHSSSAQYGIGLIMSLASFFSKKTYWSKDIIFVVADKEEIGMQAWLDGYHDSQSEYIHSSLMLGRSGPIIAAINLELGSEFTHHIDIKIEGINGQLPNLDLFNLVVRLCRLEKVPFAFQNRFDPVDRVALQWEGFQHSAMTMMLNMAKQASGNPNGIHGLFLRYRIEALTLQAVPAKRSGARLVAVGRVLEGIIRSINNLLERFHQSFFFYVLPGCERYVSIGMYMIPFGLLLIVPTLQGMALWLLSVQPNEEDPHSDDSNQSQDGDQGKSKQAKPSGKEKGGRPFGQVIPLIIGAHITGALLFISPEYLVSQHSSLFGVNPQEALVIGFLAFFIGTATLPVLGRRRNFRSSADVPSDWQLLKAITLVWYTVSLLGVSLFNFSLAFFVAVPTIPVAVIVRPTTRKILSFIQGLMLLLISPPVLLFMFLTVYHGVLNHQNTVGELIIQGVSQTLQSLFDGVLNSYLFGNKSFALVTLIWFPIWFLFWMVLFRKPVSS